MHATSKEIPQQDFLQKLTLQESECELFLKRNGAFVKKQ